jgi:hypothetical protein
LQAYEKEDNNGRFKLRDVLSVPMQRILKYHLLLDKLIEHTDPNHEEYNDLRRAREAMLDVAGFINEAARDSEHLAVINNLQENIVEWYPTDQRLANYGRLIKDGELKIKAHDDQRIKSRYVFIFDKCVLICKQLKVGSESVTVRESITGGLAQGQQFAYRHIINISEYHVDETHNRAVLSREARFSYSFHLVKNDNVMAYTIFVRTIELKQQLIKAINDALSVDTGGGRVPKSPTLFFQGQHPPPVDQTDESLLRVADVRRSGPVFALLQVPPRLDLPGLQVQRLQHSRPQAVHRAVGPVRHPQSPPFDVELVRRVGGERRRRRTQGQVVVRRRDGQDQGTERAGEEGERHVSSQDKAAKRREGQVRPDAQVSGFAETNYKEILVDMYDL